MLPTERENQSMAALASGIVDDARKLVQLEIQLAAAVLREETGRAAKAAGYLAASIVVALPAVLLAALALAEGIRALSDWPAWVCQLIVGSLFAGLAGFCLARARRYRRPA